MSELLKEARCYVADALDAHEHSDGRDLLNRIDAALSRAEPGWQPISSAPRDGTRVDLWVPGRGRLADRFWSAAGSITRGGWAHREIRNRRWGSMVEHEARPTHWRALPAPPVEAAPPAHAELSPGNSSDLRGEEG